MEVELGRDGMLALLAEVGRGERFEEAFDARAGTTVGAFIAGFTGGLARSATVAVGTVADANGNLRWTPSGFAPNSDVRVTISGKSYDLSYTVRTDGIGMYRATFGSTAAHGTYTLRAESATLHATGTVDTASR